jgi:hypothetical protein
MKTEFQYLVFKELPVAPNRKTKEWSCDNRRYGEQLGVVKWNGQWRQYCYFPTCEAVYSAGCLNDIAEFIKSVSL